MFNRSHWGMGRLLCSKPMKEDLWVKPARVGSCLSIRWRIWVSARNCIDRRWTCGLEGTGTFLSLAFVFSTPGQNNLAIIWSPISFNSSCKRHIQPPTGGPPVILCYGWFLQFTFLAGCADCSTWFNMLDMFPGLMDGLGYDTHEILGAWISLFLAELLTVNMHVIGRRLKDPQTREKTTHHIIKPRCGSRNRKKRASRAEQLVYSNLGLKKNGAFGFPRYLDMTP